MPSVTPGSKVLVTGASGYIATWVVKELLQDGYNVRGTVRSNDKGDFLKEMFEKEKTKGEFEYIIVEDIEKPDAFDEAVKGVDAVEHTASPFHLKADDPNEVIGPAVQGTLGILQSVAKYAPTVKRVVITSSTAAVVSENLPSTINLDESTFNTSSPVNVEKLGKNASNLDKYRASKVLAEQAAWKYMEDNKGKLSFDLVVLNPPFVFGPIIHPISSSSSLNTSVNNFFTALTSPPSDLSLLSKPGGCWVDVRDLAIAHRLAIAVEKAGGKRYILSAGEYTMQDLLDGCGLPNKGIAGGGKTASHPVTYNSSRAIEVLGIKFRGLGESAKDMTDDFVRRGWVKA